MVLPCRHIFPIFHKNLSMASWPAENVPRLPSGLFLAKGVSARWGFVFSSGIKLPRKVIHKNNLLSQVDWKSLDNLLLRLDWFKIADWWFSVELICRIDAGVPPVENWIDKGLMLVVSTMSFIAPPNVPCHLCRSFIWRFFFLTLFYSFPTPQLKSFFLRLHSFFFSLCISQSILKVLCWFFLLKKVWSYLSCLSLGDFCVFSVIRARFVALRHCTLNVFFLPFLAFGVRRRAASFFLTLSHWSHWRQAHPSYMYIFRTATGHRWRRRKKENTSPLGWGWNWGFRTPVKSWCGIGLLLRVEQPCSCGICRIFMGSRFPRCFWPSKKGFLSLTPRCIKMLR